MEALPRPPLRVNPRQPFDMAHGVLWNSPFPPRHPQGAWVGPSGENSAECTRRCLGERPVVESEKVRPPCASEKTGDEDLVFRCAPRKRARRK
jgi:hypothetical protein